MTKTEAVFVLFSLAVIFVTAICALVMAYQAKKETAKLTGLSDSGPKQILQNSQSPLELLQQIENKMVQLVNDRVDRLFATALGSPVLLSGIDPLSIRGVREKIGEKIKNTIDDSSDALQEQIDKTLAGIVVDMSRLPEFQEKLKSSILESLSDQTDDITEQIFDLDDDDWEDTYLAIKKNIEKVAKEWISEELQRTDSPIRKKITDSISSHIENAFDEG